MPGYYEPMCVLDHPVGRQMRVFFAPGVLKLNLDERRQSPLLTNNPLLLLSTRI